jgi:3-dehydroquinate synthase
MEIVHIGIPNNEYKVHIGRDIFEQIALFLDEFAKNQKVLIVTDEFFKDKYAVLICNSLKAKNLSPQIHVMKGGKSSKSFSEVLRIYGELENKDFARDSVLIALGGGVVGDLAGFVASTWYRGMSFVHVPTTLMAMIDSSIGGKVAINFRETINGVGNYYHPNVNFMDLNLIDSLGDRDYCSGLAEVIKCAIIADSSFVNYLEENRENILQRDEKCLVYAMRRTIEIKVDHVSNDIREGGKRLLLNYGHTLGHAIEMATQTKNGESFRHGEGVSLGIVAVLYIAQLYFKTSEVLRHKIQALLKSYKLPVSFSSSEFGFERDELINSCMRLILKDKKRKENNLRFILVDQLGNAGVYTDISKSFILQAFKQVIKE